MTNTTELRAPINKQQVEELIDRLASKELTFGCRVDCGNANVKPECKVHIFCGLDMYRDGNYIALLGDGDCASLELDDTKAQKYGIKILGHPIFIGNVLSKLHPDHIHEDSAVLLSLIEKWQACDFTKSLQSIAEMDTKEPNELLELLLSLFPNE